MNAPVTYGRSDQIAAEVLPERTASAVVVTPMGGGGAINGGGGRIAILSSRQTTTTYTETRMAGLLDLGLNATPVKTQSCVPAAIASA